MNTLASERLATIVAGPFSAVNPTRLIRAGLRGPRHPIRARRQGLCEGPPRLWGLGCIHSDFADRSARPKALAADGISRIVLPESNLQSLPSAGPAAMSWPYTLLLRSQSKAPLWRACRPTRAGRPSRRARQLGPSSPTAACRSGRDLLRLAQLPTTERRRPCRSSILGTGNRLSQRRARRALV